MSPMQVLQRSCLSTIGGILRRRRLSLFGHVARLDPRIPAHDALRLTVDIPTKAERQWPAVKTAGSPSQRISQQDSGGCQRCTAAIYAVEI